MTKFNKNKNKLKLFLSKDGELVPDVLGKIPGRGFCINFDKNELKKLVSDTFKMLSSNEIAQRFRKIQIIIIQQIKKKILSHLSLAKKSGNALSGFEKVREAISSRKEVYILFHARDGSTKELNRMLSGSAPPLIVNLFDSEELGKIFNKGNVVHSCIVGRGLAESLKLDLKKLEGIQN